MSWIFDTHATPGTNPWSWEHGSPESFAGRRPCGCRRCESCKCYKFDISEITLPGQSAHPAVSAPADDELALCPMWLHSTCHGDDLLAKYYKKYGAFNGAKVIITHKGKDNPAAPAKYSKEAPMPAAMVNFGSANLCRAIVEESNRGVKRRFSS